MSWEGFQGCGVGSNGCHVSPPLGTEQGQRFVPPGLRFVHGRAKGSSSQVPIQQPQINTLIRKGDFGAVAGFLLRCELIWEELFHSSIWHRVHKPRYTINSVIITELFRETEHKHYFISYIKGKKKCMILYKQEKKKKNRKTMPRHFDSL